MGASACEGVSSTLRGSFRLLSEFINRDLVRIVGGLHRDRIGSDGSETVLSWNGSHIQHRATQRPRKANAPHLLHAVRDLAPRVAQSSPACPAGSLTSVSLAVMQMRFFFSTGGGGRSSSFPTVEEPSCKKQNQSRNKQNH